MSEEDLQIAEQRREAKVKEGWERYTQLNADFQRTARRDKEVFLNEQCKEIEKNNRMGKAGNLLKKIGDIKGIFQTRMGTIKDRNSKDLTEAEEIKMWKEYTKNFVGKKYTKYTKYARKFSMTLITRMVLSFT